MPTKGCPQPHPEAGCGGRRGGRAGGGGLPGPRLWAAALLICLDHRSGPRVALGLPPTIKSCSITEAGAVTLGSQMLLLQTPPHKPRRNSRA